VTRREKLNTTNTQLTPWCIHYTPYDLPCSSC